MMESTMISEDAAESRLLLKQMYGSFGSKSRRKGRKVYQQNTHQHRAVCRMGQENFPAFVTGSLRSLFLVVEHICKIGLLGYLLM